MKRLFVVSGNYAEFLDFRRCITASTFYKPIYVNDPEKLRGLKKEAYTYIGTWYRRRNLAEMQQIMIAQEMYFIAASAIVPAADQYWEDKE